MAITLDGTNGITTPMYNGAVSSNQVTPTTAFKNRIINGSMVIDQRNAGASVTNINGGVFSVDRWRTYGSQASKFTVQQNANSITPPAGFANYLGVTSSSAYSLGAGDFFFIYQSIEGFNFADCNWGTANAKTVTLSFWVRSSLTGTFGGTFENSNSDRSYPFSYTISSANTWTQISVVVPGDTSGTWVGATNGLGVNVYFGLGVGTTYSGTANTWNSGNYIAPTGAVSVVSTNAATWYVTGVQLEVGSSATSFDYRPYTTEFELAQRYYQKSSYGTTSYPSSGGYARAYASFAVVMRTAPTMAFTDLGSGGSSIANGSYVDGYYNTYGSLGASSAGTFSWTATAEL
jgi:hypothetical protein